MIFLRPFVVRNRFADNGCKFVGTFVLFYKLSRKNHEDSLKSCEFYLDLFRKIKEKRTDIPFDDFNLLRSVLIRSPEIDFNENDRLSYIDNENEEIPINQQSDLTEAVIYSKFAQEYHKEKNKCVPLIITKAKVKSRKPSKKSKTAESSNLTAETPEGEAAIQELQNCLKIYKKQIVAEVAHQVREEMTDELLKKMNMLLSQKMNVSENPSSSGTFQTFLPKIPKASKKFRDDEEFLDAESLDAEFVDDFERSYKEFSSEMIKVEKMVKSLVDPMPGSEVPLNFFKKPSLQESKAPFSLDFSESSSDEDTSSADFRRITDLATKRNYESLKTGKPIKSSINHQINGNNSSQKAEKARPSRKSGNNDDNHDVNEKQHPSDSDNISILSNHSHMSDFMTEYEESYEKAPPKDNVPISAFDAETREKSYEKNIAETSEDTSIAPQLEKRSGGAYSYVPYILEESRENVFDVSSSKSAKSADKKFKMFSSDEEPRGFVFFGKKKTAEQQKSSEERETRQPRRRFVFDHNTAKGLGDTEQTSPEKRGANESGERVSSGSFFFGPDCPFYGFRHVACTRRPCFSLPFSIQRPCFFYVDQVPPQLSEPQWPTGYHSSPETMHILPETLISGAAHAASSAYTTARKFIEKIRSPPPGSPNGPQPPKM